MAEPVISGQEQQTVPGTTILSCCAGKEGFVFPGCYLRVVLSHFKRREYLFRWPAPNAMKRIRGRIRELTDRRRWYGMKNIKDVIEVVDPVLRGWENYFRTGNASLEFRQVGRHVSDMRKTIGKPCAENPHARFEWGIQETGPQGHRA